MDFLMFYGMTCLSFFLDIVLMDSDRLSMYFRIDYYRFRNYRNIGAVFVSDNIVSISFSRKKNENKSDLTSYRFHPYRYVPNYSPLSAACFNRSRYRDLGLSSEQSIQHNICG
jgi:hypothetical protein